MTVWIEPLDGTRASQHVLDGINRLLPMLSKSASPMSLGELHRMLSSQTRTFVAWDGTSIVGMASLVVVYQPVGIVCHVEDVVVDETKRGLRIGEQLMQSLIEALPDGWRQLDLTSNPARTPAHRLYEKLGFVLRETGNYRLSPAT